MKIADRLTVWRANLRKKRSKLRTARLEKQSAKKHHVTLEEVNKMLSCKQICEDFAGVVDSLRKGLPVKNQELNLCTTIIAALLIFRSWQRPGAVMNATLDEYKDRSEVRVRGEAMVVMKVAEHKTGAVASAKIILKHADLAKLNSYVTVVRKALDPKGRSPYLLCSPGGKKMPKLRQEILAKRYGFERVTPSQVRVSGAIEAARKLPDKDQCLVTKQLSHTLQTYTMYYEAIAGPCHATKAFCSMQQLHLPSSSDSDQGSHIKRHQMRTRASSPDGESDIFVHRKKHRRFTSSDSDDDKGVPKRKKRRPFTAEEREVINLYFEQNIKERSTPTLDECATFVRDHHLARTPRQVQDRVKTVNRGKQLTAYESNFTRQEQIPIYNTIRLLLILA